MVWIALENVGPETRVRDSGEGTRLGRDIWIGVPNRIAGVVRPLDPSVGSQGVTLLRHAVDILLQ